MYIYIYIYVYMYIYIYTNTYTFMNYTYIYIYICAIFMYIPPKNGEIALQTPRPSRLLDLEYCYGTKIPAETLPTLLTLVYLVYTMRRYASSSTRSSIGSWKKIPLSESELQLVPNASYLLCCSEDFYYMLGESQ